jgi:hypothetical protein
VLLAAMTVSPTETTPSVLVSTSLAINTSPGAGIKAWVPINVGVRDRQHGLWGSVVAADCVGDGLSGVSWVLGFLSGQFLAVLCVDMVNKRTEFVAGPVDVTVVERLGGVVDLLTETLLQPVRYVEGVNVGGRVGQLLLRGVLDLRGQSHAGRQVAVARADIAAREPSRAITEPQPIPFVLVGEDRVQVGVTVHKTERHPETAIDVGAHIATGEPPPDPSPRQKTPG